MKVLAWHVHGAWSTSFVQGAFETLVPTVPERDADGRGRAQTYAWPERAREVAPAALAAEGMDVVVLQRMHDVELLRQWTGMTAGVDVPAVYVEHNTPTGHAATSRHPLAEQSHIPIVHVTPFNALMWDSGSAPTVVIEHGITDPGHRWTGQLQRAAVVVNEPVRRNRITGTDLLPVVAQAAPVDVFGIGTEQLTAAQLGPGGQAHGDRPHEQLLDELAERRLYVHLCRWTSLGLSLIEAMQLGMPVVGLATTESSEALAGSGAVLTNRPESLAAAVAAVAHDLELARSLGEQARSFALERFGLPTFVAAWDQLLMEVSR
jgi:hypothetical protein